VCFYTSKLFFSEPTPNFHGSKATTTAALLQTATGHPIHTHYVHSGHMLHANSTKNKVIEFIRRNNFDED
jgi:hypothetical protein